MRISRLSQQRPGHWDEGDAGYGAEHRSDEAVLATFIDQTRARAEHEAAGKCTGEGDRLVFIQLHRHDREYAETGSKRSPERHEQHDADVHTVLARLLMCVSNSR